ncbi:MAG: hypothetical protein JNL97_03255 [Verrucomicrobiales bacterium]|nr:hypothetical protein [Verrucomicrobiales bacterium]
MKLLLDTLRLFAGKIAAVLAVAAVVVGIAFLVSWAKSQKNLRSDIASLRLRTEASLRDWQTNRVRALNVEMQLHRLEADRPNPILRPNDYLAWRAEMQAAEATVAAARNARDRAHALHEELRTRLASLESRVDDTLEALIHTAHDTAWTIGIAAAVLLAGPFVWKAFWYYGIAPVAGRSRPIHILPPNTSGTCRAVRQGKGIEVTVEPHRPLLARMDWLQQYGPGLEKRTRFLLDARYPFVSYASGLREMTEVRCKPDHAADRVLLTSAEDPNAYLVAIELEDHPGVVLKPGVVVAVQGPITLRSRWCFGSVHAWISGRLRHILFAGTGTLYLSGHGGIEWHASEAPVVVEEALVLGYDGRTPFATARTETFWPYFRERTSLFDYRFPGGHGFVRQSSAPSEVRRRANPFVRTVDAILNTTGKLLGF